jgi:hypothetical protein
VRVSCGWLSSNAGPSRSSPEAVLPQLAEGYSTDSTYRGVTMWVAYRVQSNLEQSYHACSTITRSAPRILHGVPSACLLGVLNEHRSRPEYESILLLPFDLEYPYVPLATSTTANYPSATSSPTLVQQAYGTYFMQLAQQAISLKQGNSL